jgi:PAS domain S-box-containing protein
MRMQNQEYHQILQFSNHGIVATDENSLITFSDGIWICDNEGKVININGASEKLGGIKRQDIIGKKVSDIVKDGLYSDYVTDEVIQTKQPVSQLQHNKNTNKTVLCVILI